MMKEAAVEFLKCVTQCILKGKDVQPSVEGYMITFRQRQSPRRPSDPFLFSPLPVCRGRGLVVVGHTLYPPNYSSKVIR